ncbi:MAG TPA: amino acid adenylation domain-containing protein, partial [Herpetosiphonaceae bacterium]
LHALSRREDATLFMTLLTAWSTLLARLSGQWDLTVGTPIANRTQAALEPLIGFFVNTLVLRTDLSGTPTFLDALARVRATTLAAYAHQDLPFEQVVEALQAQRSLSSSPLFQVLFALQNAPLPALRLGEVTLAVQDMPQTTAKFDLSLVLTETDHGLDALLEYATDLFEPATIARLATHFRTLLDALVAQPQQPLATLPLLTTSEREQLLTIWNQTQRPYPSDRTVQALVTAQAQRQPDAVALVYGAEQLTYAELDARANQLAHQLRARGVGPEVLVGVCLERSLHLVVAMLAILKAGGAYVPLDPAYPQDRLAFMLADTEAPVVLTDTRLRERVPVVEGARPVTVLCLDTAWERIEPEWSNAPVSEATAADLAYVMYTSGSTGQPKGTAITHQAIVRLICNTDYVALTPEDRIAQASNTAFDAATFEIWGALISGARLVGLDRETALSPDQFATWLRDQAITTMFMTTAWFNQVVASVPAAFASMRQVIFGGEEGDPQRVRDVLKHGKPQHLINGYGPTESTTFASWYAVETLPEDATTVPIGRPIANTTLYVLDAHLQPVPIGVPGELYIGGDGLARGYFRRPSLTAEKFIPHPFGGENSSEPGTQPGARLYRTGDLVRTLPDGTIVFLGRIDQQIKLRGFRVEIGEIEAVLSQHPAVRQAFVLLRDDLPGDRRLVAYLVAQPDQSIVVAEVRTFLLRQLPEYLVPAAFVVLDTLPLTPNGKLDRRALPLPDYGQTDTPVVAPRTPLEAEIAGIWAEVLGVAQVGIQDNFFALGGHSLLATQVITRIRETCQIALPLRALFETPTVAGLAEQIAQTQPEPSLLPALTPRPATTDALPLSFAQQRLWFLQQLDPSSTVYHTPILVRLTGALDVDALQRSLHTIIQRHEALRTAFVLHDAQPVQAIVPQVALPLPLNDLSALNLADRTRAIDQLTERDIQQPFDLGTPPLLRARVLRLAADEHLLLLTLHHIITDGWSLGVLLRELAALYADPAVVLPALSVQYADYALWQREWLQGAVREQQLAFWRAQLAGAPETLQLPTDHPRPPVQSFRGAAYHFQLAPSLTAALHALSQREDATLFMTLLTAWSTLLAHLSGQWDLTVGTPIANRTQAALEPLIGFFVNTLVLRTDLSGTPTFLDALARVRTTTLAAYAHQDLPFEQVVEALQAQRSLSSSPLFQVLFALQNAPLPALRLGEVTLAVQDTPQTTAKFDLSLVLTETDHGLDALLEYATDLFDAATIARLAQHFVTLLDAIVVAPQQPLATLPLLTTSEREQLLTIWNQTQRPYPSDRTVQALVTAQALRQPDAVALVYGAEQLTYAELDTRANRLAHQLRARGVGPEVLVGVCLERSLHLVVAMLATLKAGGAYVPLDPAYPQDRLAFMLQDTQTPVILTEERFLALLPEHSAYTVCLDTAWEQIAHQPATDPAVPVTADGLAYVMYTSGSTGQPKGTAITHQAIVRLICNTDYVALTPEDRIAQASNTAFDAATFEIWGTLISGAQLVGVDRETALSPEAFAELLREQAITTIFMTTAWFNQVASLAPDALHSLKNVLFGGEASDPQRVRTVLHQHPPQRLLNVYGPTESTTFASWYEVRDVPAEATTVPIGYPIANTTLYLLDGLMQPVPIGIPGELYIGGDGLARGYLHRPELTAEKFVPNPFGAPGARLYRTGDLARYRADGAIDFVGRIDHQVKLRGFRIELGEIEAVLGQHPAVQETIVVVREDQAGDPRLVAYVVENQEPRTKHPGDDTDGSRFSVLGSTLRAFVKERLPEYMLPAAIVVLERLPLTPNGKVDRRALPAPDYTQAVETFVAPRTPLEEQIAGIWAEVLGVAQVGIQDNFFALGGHSLLATQVITRIRETCQIALPLR